MNFNIASGKQSCQIRFIGVLCLIITLLYDILKIYSVMKTATALT